MSLWTASLPGHVPRTSRMNGHVKTPTTPQVRLHLDVHPPVLDTSSHKQTSRKTTASRPGGDSRKPGGGFGGQVMNSLRYVYHSLCSASTPVTWVNPVEVMMYSPVQQQQQQQQQYPYHPQSQYQYSIKPNTPLDPSGKLWFPAPPGGSQLGYLDPLHLWQEKSWYSGMTPEPYNGMQVPTKESQVYKKHQPLNPEAKEWVPKGYRKDTVSSAVSMEAPGECGLKDEIPVIPYGLSDQVNNNHHNHFDKGNNSGVLDPVVQNDSQDSGCQKKLTHTGSHNTNQDPNNTEYEFVNSVVQSDSPDESLDYCEITDAEVDAVRSTGKIAGTIGSPENQSLQVEKENVNTPDSSPSCVLAVKSSESSKHSEEERKGDTGVKGCDNITLSYASVVGRAAQASPEPHTDNFNKSKPVEQPLPKIFLKDKTYPKEKAAPSMEHKKKMPSLFRCGNKNQKSTRKFLKELCESSPVKSKDSDSVCSTVFSSSLEVSGTPNVSPHTEPPVMLESTALPSPRDRPTSHAGLPSAFKQQPSQCSVSESSSVSSHTTRSVSESSIESLDIDFVDVDTVDEVCVAPDNCARTVRQTQCRTKPNFSNTILAHILGCDDSDSEDSEDDSEETDSDWDEEPRENCILLDDTWDTLGFTLIIPKVEKVPKQQSSTRLDLCLDNYVCDNLDDECSYPEIDLKEVNKKWEQQIEKDVLGSSDRKVTFGEVVIHPMVVWTHAYKMSRKGPWEQCARDRERFNHRIAEVGRAISPILQDDHRKVFYQKLQSWNGSQVSVPHA